MSLRRTAVPAIGMVDRGRPTLAHVYDDVAAVSQSQIHTCSAPMVESHSINGKRWSAGSDLRGNLALYDHVGIERGALLRRFGRRLRLLRLSLQRSAGSSTDCLRSRLLQGGTTAHQGNHADMSSPENVSSHEMNLHRSSISAKWRASGGGLRRSRRPGVTRSERRENRRGV